MLLAIKIQYRFTSHGFHMTNLVHDLGSFDEQFDEAFVDGVNSEA
jgi:hypothetical protein